MGKKKKNRKPKHDKGIQQATLSVKRDGSYSRASDFGTPEHRAKNIVSYEYVSEDPDSKDETKRLVNKTQVTLDWFYHHFKVITWEQHEAGTKFGEEVEYAGIYFVPHVNYSMEMVDGGGWKEKDYTPKQLYHRQQLDKVQKLVGDEMFNLLVDICCFNHKMGEIEKRQKPKWPEGSGKIVLRMGLTRLVEFYGIR